MTFLRFGSEAAEKKEEKKAKKIVEAAVEVEDDEDKKDGTIPCRTAMGKNIMRNVFKPELPKVNELFIAGRMAYVMDLDEEVMIQSIPATHRCLLYFANSSCFKLLWYNIYPYDNDDKKFCF